MSRTVRNPCKKPLDEGQELGETLIIAPGEGLATLELEGPELGVARIDGGKIAEIAAFGTELFPMFGPPPVLA